LQHKTLWINRAVVLFNSLVPWPDYRHVKRAPIDTAEKEMCSTMNWPVELSGGIRPGTLLCGGNWYDMSSKRKRKLPKRVLDGVNDIQRQ
jgi:hypothetical protein